MRSVNASAASFARSLTFRLSPHVADASVSGATPAASALPVVPAGDPTGTGGLTTTGAAGGEVRSFDQIRLRVVFDRSTRSRRAFGQRVRRQFRQVSHFQVVAPRGRRVSVQAPRPPRRCVTSPPPSPDRGGARAAPACASRATPASGSPGSGRGSAAARGPCDGPHPGTVRGPDAVSGAASLFPVNPPPWHARRV